MSGLITRRGLLKAAIAVPSAIVAAPAAGAVGLVQDALAAEIPVLGIPADAPRKSFPERRAFVEAQDWWGDPDEPWPYRHIHVGCAFPDRELIVGNTFQTDVRVIYHDQSEGKMTRLRVSRESTNVWSLPSSQFYPVSDGAAHWFPVSIDLSGWEPGLWEFRIAAYIQARADLQLYNSTGWLAWVKQRSGHMSRPADYGTAGRGWATPTQYVNARRKGAFDWEPVPALYRPNVSLVRLSGSEVTSHAVYVDPAIHDASKGIVVKEGAGGYTGAVTIDTTSLANGVHKLFLQAMSRVAAGVTSGVQVIPFVVAH